MCSFQGPGLAGYEDVPVPEGFQTYGLQRLDHAVGNVPDLMEQVQYMEKITGERTAVAHFVVDRRGFGWQMEASEDRRI